MAHPGRRGANSIPVNTENVAAQEIKAAALNSEIQQVVPASKEDLFLSQIVAESAEIPSEWKIDAESVVVDEQFKSMFALPKQLRKGIDQASQAKDNSYCWVEVSDERIARTYQQGRWLPVTRDNHNWLPMSLFSMHSLIERRGYSRHALFYQPKKFNEAIKNAAVAKANSKLKESKDKLENSTGPVRLEEVTTSGGYGTNPGSDPIATDWQGNRTNYDPGSDD